MQPAASAIRGRFSAGSDKLATFCAVLLGFAIPVSVVADNILLAVILICFWLGGRLREKFQVIAGNPVAIAALMLFGLLAVALAWGERASGDGLRYLIRYLDLLFIPVFVVLFRDPLARRQGLLCFCAAMITTFVIAHLAVHGLLRQHPVLPRYPEFAGAFKYSITHGLLSAYAAFAFALLAQRQARWPQRVLLGVLALVAVQNVITVSVSRTAYIILALLAVYLFYAMSGKRGLLAACVLLTVLFGAAYGGSPTFRERIDTVAVEIQGWRSDRPAKDSVDLRLEWYRHSLDLVRERPLLGSGTGSFPRVYGEAVKNTEMLRTTNPHNEYMLIAVQTGLAGLALLLHLFWRQLALARQLATPLETHLARGLVITMVTGCMFNSFLLDHTEGLFYAWFTGLFYAGLRSRAGSA